MLPLMVRSNRNSNVLLIFPNYWPIDRHGEPEDTLESFLLAISCTLHWWPQKLLSLSESYERNGIEISSFFSVFPALYHTLSTDEPNTERQHFQRPEHLPEQPNVSNLSKDGALLQ